MFFVNVGCEEAVRLGNGDAKDTDEWKIPVPVDLKLTTVFRGTLVVVNGIAVCPDLITHCFTGHFAVVPSVSAQDQPWFSSGRGLDDDAVVEIQDIVSAMKAIKLVLNAIETAVKASKEQDLLSFVLPALKIAEAIGRGIDRSMLVGLFKLSDYTAALTGVWGKENEKQNPVNLARVYCVQSSLLLKGGNFVDAGLVGEKAILSRNESFRSFEVRALALLAKSPVSHSDLNEARFLLTYALELLQRGSKSEEENQDDSRQQRLEKSLKKVEKMLMKEKHLSSEDVVNQQVFFVKSGILIWWKNSQGSPSKRFSPVLSTEKEEIFDRVYSFLVQFQDFINSFETDLCTIDISPQEFPLFLAGWVIIAGCGIICSRSQAKFDAAGVFSLISTSQRSSLLSHTTFEEIEKLHDFLSLKVAEQGSALFKGRYPSTPHLPFSPEVFDDDSQLSEFDASSFLGCPVVITEKLDGGNCCIHQGKVYARTHKNEATHESFSPIKSIFEGLWHEIKENGDLWNCRIFGENMTGIHSIEYDRLTSYFFLFSIRYPNGKWASWDEVERVSALLNVPHAPILFKGEFGSLKEIRSFMEERASQPSSMSSHHEPEGFVIRLQQEFCDDTFERSMAKFVRKGHVQTDDSWKRTWKKAKLYEQPEEKSNANPLGKTVKKNASKSSAGRGGLKTPKLMIMVGLPCSGKSTYSKLLADSNSSRWERVSIDEIKFKGKKSDAEDLVGRITLRQGNKCCIVDSCNVSQDERRKWLEIAMFPDRAVAVFFNIPAEECKARALSRENHPTEDLFKDQFKGGRIIDTFAKKLVPPSKDEGFSEVYQISNLEDFNRVLTSFGGPSFESKEE
jgi:predicted kinase